MRALLLVAAVALLGLATASSLATRTAWQRLDAERARDGGA